MEINDIANLGTAIEMRREVLKLAMAKNVPEESVWQQLERYRKRLAIRGKSSSPVTICSIIQRIFPKDMINFHITESPIEDTLKYALNAKNIQFDTQKKIGKYRVDFFFPDGNLIVEVDGKDYHSNPEQIDRDAKRDKVLMQKGYTILRFTGKEIYGAVNRCIAKILLFLED